MTYIMYPVNNSWSQTLDQVEIEKGMTTLRFCIKHQIFEIKLQDKYYTYGQVVSWASEL
jgi:hypothetical protein